MASEVVTPAADVDTQINETDELNPAVTSYRKTVHVTLQYDGVEFDPVVLYDALEAVYDVVGSDMTYSTRGTYIFNISAT